jgi:hypothetical protein
MRKADRERGIGKGLRCGDKIGARGGKKPIWWGEGRVKTEVKREKKGDRGETDR